MKRFVNFVNELWLERYDARNVKLIEAKIPVAFYAPSRDAAGHLAFAEHLRKFGVNVRYIFTLLNEIPNLPSEITLLPLPPTKIQNLKFVFMLHGVPELLMAKKFLDAEIEPIFIEQSGTTIPRYNFCMDHIDEIFDVYNSFIDDESRETYLGCILALVSNRISHCRFANTDQYLLHGFLPKSRDIVIDGGACDGGTASMFADFGCQVISFEMDRENFEITSRVAREKNFVVENFGLGDSNRDIFYTHSDSGGSQINSGSLKTRLVTLDSYVREKNLSSVDFIKLDIEGSELSMLQGAADTITRFKPKLEISAYHKLEDLWTLQQFLKSIRPDYEFAFRHFETTFDSAPYMFNDSVVESCNLFDLPMRYPGLGEFVLLAR